MLSLQYGKVKEVRMALDDRNQPIGFAFVEFEEEVRGMTAIPRSVSDYVKERCVGCACCQ